MIKFFQFPCQSVRRIWPNNTPVPAHAAVRIIKSQGVFFEKVKIMEELYKSLLSGAEMLTEQLKGHLFEMTELEGPVLILVDACQQFCANHPSRTSFLSESPELLEVMCGQIDDGDDPCVYEVDGGCLVGTQLATEKNACGYFLIFLPGYRTQTVQANMDLFELLLAQTQLICQLLEKNNQLHHLQLTGLSRNSAVLCSRS